jgi:hypothetical protein
MQQVLQTECKKQTHEYSMAGHSGLHAYRNNEICNGQQTLSDGILLRQDN